MVILVYQNCCLITYLLFRLYVVIRTSFGLWATRCQRDRPVTGAGAWGCAGKCRFHQCSGTGAEPGWSEWDYFWPGRGALGVRLDPLLGHIAVVCRVVGCEERIDLHVWCARYG